MASVIVYAFDKRRFYFEETDFESNIQAEGSSKDNPKYQLIQDAYPDFAEDILNYRRDQKPHKHPFDAKNLVLEYFHDEDLEQLIFVDDNNTVNWKFYFNPRRKTSSSKFDLRSGKGTRNKKNITI